MSSNNAERSVMNDKIDVELKLINGKELPVVLNGAQATYEEDKYLQIKIVNKAEINAFFKLKVRSKNSSISEDYTFNLIPPNGSPVYYLYYIGGPASFAPESKDGGYDLNYEIQDLQFQA